LNWLGFDENRARACARVFPRVGGNVVDSVDNGKLQAKR
jgi:hypothetical protein